MKDRLEAIANGLVSTPPLVAILALGLFAGVLFLSSAVGLDRYAGAGIAVGILVAFVAAIWAFQTEV